MNAKALIVAGLGLIVASPAFAIETCVAPGPEMGDGLPGLVILAALVAGYFGFRHFRGKQRA